MNATEVKDAEVLPPERGIQATPGEVNPLKVIEERNRLLEKILEYAITTTHVGQWQDLGGKPWLTGPGAEAVARRCAVKITETKCTKEWMEDEDGRYYLYTYEATFSLPGAYDSIIAYGHCSSRDSFLGTGVRTDEKDNIRELPEVDEGCIRQSAYTNCTVNGVTRLLGIRGMSWERLEALGLKQAEMGKVEFRHGAKGGGAPAGDFRFKFGKGKDKTPSEVMDKDLEWYLGIFRGDLDNPEKARFRKNTEKGIAAIEAELARRKGGTAQPGQQQPTAAPTLSVWTRLVALANARGLDERSLGDLVRQVTGKQKIQHLDESDFAKVEAAMPGEDSDIPT